MPDEREEWVRDREYLENQLWASLEKFLAEGGDLKEVAEALGQESSLYFNRTWNPASVVANLLSELSGLGNCTTWRSGSGTTRRRRNFPCRACWRNTGRPA